jgi:hypothetical protein
MPATEQAPTTMLVTISVTRQLPASLLVIALVPIFASMTDISLLMLPVISLVMVLVLMKGPPVCETTSTNTTTTTITIITSTSTQFLGAELEQEVHTRCKRLHKHISEKPNDSNLVDFKPIITQMDDSEDFSSQENTYHKAGYKPVFSRSI